MSIKTKQIELTDLKKIRKFFHKKQNYICPILKFRVNTNDMVVDHAHTTNSNNLGKSNEAGLIRGVIHRQANTMEGKITNSFIRCGLHKMDISLPTFLRNLADFIENPPMIPLKYMHPSEKEKPLILKKNSVKKLSKLFKEKYPNRKLPSVLIYKLKKMKKGKKKEKEKTLTTGIKKLYQEFKLKPEFKK